MYRDDGGTRIGRNGRPVRVDRDGRPVSYDEGGRPGTGRRTGRRRRRGGVVGGGSSSSGKIKGSWWRRWTWKKALAVAGVACGGFILIGVIMVGLMYAGTPVPTAVNLAALQQNTVVYFNDGKTVVGTIGSTDRQLLSYSQIPANVRDAVLAAEDRHFYTEGGISYTGTLRALTVDLTGGSTQGGSTITQQFVRNYYTGIGTAQTATRKVKEIFVALKLSKEKSKDWILTQYLNTIFLGDGAYGVGAAAQVYFGVPAQQLTTAQAAVIAAIIQQPGLFPMPQYHQQLVARWQYVLSGLVAMGDLTAQQAAAQKFPRFTGVQALGAGWTGYNGYIMQAVQAELESTYHYTLDQIGSEGLHVVTTFRKPLMDQLYASVNTEEHRMKHSQQLAPGVVTSTGLPSYVRVGAVLEQPGTGAIMAMYSGTDWQKNNYDNALQSRNQVGSSMKPYVLATAVSQGMNVKTSVLNGYSPLYIPPDSEQMTYASTTPHSTGGWYGPVSNDEVVASQGPVSVVTASAESLNTAYTDLYHRVGGQNVAAMAQKFGVDTGSYSNGGSGLADNPHEVGNALGQSSLTVEEQATMMATLANGGVYATPHVIQSITTGTTAVSAKVMHQQVLTPSQAADVDYALSFDTSPMGTAAGDGLSNGQEVIAKTGTTNLSQSAFFLGAIPRYSLAVGMFVDHPGCKLPRSQQYLCQATSSLSYAPPAGLQTLFGVGGLAGYGGQWPATIWHTFGEKEFVQLPVQPFPTPAFGGTKWNLLGPVAKSHPHPQPVQQPQQPQPTQTCIRYFGQCLGGGQSPSPSAPAPTCSNILPPFCTTPSPTVSAVPTPTRTKPGNGGGGGGGGAAAGLVGVLAAVPGTKFLARRKRRKRG